MLQSEFYERTNVNLTPEEYAEVEAVYTEVEMGKDDFCKEWLKLRKSRLMGEIQRAMLKMEHLIYEKSDTISKMQTMLKEKDRIREEMLTEVNKRNGEHFTDFAKKIILSGVEDKNLYDIIEEECGIKFIILVKRKAGIPLSESEIDYMVGKL